MTDLDSTPFVYSFLIGCYSLSLSSIVTAFKSDNWIPTHLSSTSQSQSDGRRIDLVDARLLLAWTQGVPKK